MDLETIPRREALAGLSMLAGLSLVLVCTIVFRIVHATPATLPGRDSNEHVWVGTRPGAASTVEGGATIEDSAPTESHAYTQPSSALEASAAGALGQSDAQAVPAVSTVDLASAGGDQAAQGQESGVVRPRFVAPAGR